MIVIITSCKYWRKANPEQRRSHIERLCGYNIYIYIFIYLLLLLYIYFHIFIIIIINIFSYIYYCYYIYPHRVPLWYFVVLLGGWGGTWVGFPQKTEADGTNSTDGEWRPPRGNGTIEEKWIKSNVSSYMMTFGEATMAAKMASPLVAANVPQNTAVTSAPWFSRLSQK